MDMSSHVTHHLKEIRGGSQCSPASQTVVHAQENTSDNATDTLDIDELTVVSKRDNRVSSGATKLPLAIKETPQTTPLLIARRWKTLARRAATMR
jgi:hypothetical protein